MDYPNIVLLSGTGRNVGKTTFVCSLLKHFTDLRLVTVKVSPHWHRTVYGEVLLFEDMRLLLTQETSNNSNKDTARMLRCGAAQVYYLQHTDEDAMMQAFNYLVKTSQEGAPMIIESALLAKYVRPALHLRITRSDTPPSDKAVPDVPFDKLVTFNGTQFDMRPDELGWNTKNNSWFLSETRG